MVAVVRCRAGSSEINTHRAATAAQVRYRAGSSEMIDDQLHCRETVRCRAGSSEKTPSENPGQSALLRLLVATDSTARRYRKYLRMT